MSYTVTWMKWEDIIPKEISKSQKDKFCMTLFILHEVSKVINLQKQKLEWWWPGTGKREK